MMIALYRVNLKAVRVNRLKEFSSAARSPVIPPQTIMGEIMRVTRMAKERVSVLNPGAIKGTIRGAKSI